MKPLKKSLLGLTTFLGLIGLTLTGCSSASDKVILYSNADDEAIAAIESSLNEDGYEGQYEIQTFGTSELGGKLLAEGKDIEADMVTMSTFYLESAQNQHEMFQDLTWDVNTQQDFPDYVAPLTVQEGAIIVNDEMAKSENLDLPQSIKDLADPKYEGKVSVVDIDSSSTAWLMVQALVAEYGEEEAQEILAGIYKNASNHIESSGSGPLNKVVSGEVPFGFGLRHQVAVKQNEGAPISLIDPTEGNFSLTESVAVIDKEDSEKAELAQKMSETIIQKGRPKVQEFYPVALYEGEETDSSKQSAHPKQFDEPLTAELLAKHQEISNKAKEMAQQ